MKQLPSAIPAERVVLGSIIVSQKEFNEIRDLLTKDSFFELKHQQIYEAVSTIYGRGDKCDILTVNNELQKKGYTDLFNDLVDIQGCSSYNVYEHAAIIQDKAIRRQFFNIAKELEKNAFSEETDILDVINDVKEKVNGLYIDNTNSIMDMTEAVKELVEQMNRNASAKKALTGMPTKFEEFDKRSGGLQGSDLVIIAGETSQGKTSLALSICSNIASFGYPCAIYSLEMSAKQLTARLSAKETGIPSNTLLYFPLNENQFNVFDINIKKVCDKPIFIDQRSNANIDTIISSIRSLHAKLGVKLVVVDYLQLLSMNDKRKSVEEKTAEAARLFKNLAKELDICIIALSQLARNKENPVPTISRLRNSGQIEEAADTIILCYRPEVYNKRFLEPFEKIDPDGTAMIDVAKGRNIGTFKFLARFCGATTSFSPIENYNELPEAKKNKNAAPF